MRRILEILAIYSYTKVSYQTDALLSQYLIARSPYFLMTNY